MAENTLFGNHPSIKIFVDMLNASGLISGNSSPDLSPIRKRSVSPEIRKREVEILLYERFKGRNNNYSKIADKNASELIKQEEQARLKLEKKKAKKERQKQKKNGSNEDNSEKIKTSKNDNSINKIITNTENLVLSPDNKEDETLDINAAFVNKAIKKVKHTIVFEEPNSKKDDKDLNSLVKTAIEFENKHHYKEALQNLSEAINLSTKRFDLILKRSFIYYQLAKFEKSIRDAQKVLLYSPNNIDGYYRLAEGYFAMNNLSEAEEAFTKLLSFNAYTDEASKRLFSIRVKQLEEMGYHPNEAFTALLKSKNKSLDEAIEFLTALGEGKNTEDLYYSDEEDDSEEDLEEDDEKDDMEEASGHLVESISRPHIVICKGNPLLTDPSNPLQCCSLFIGNLKKDITHKEVEDVFIKFGNIKYIKLVTDTDCYGFVNFEESNSAGRAMEALQGSWWLLSTVPLVVRYPTNVVNKIIATTKNTELIAKLSALQSVRSTFPTEKPPEIKPTGVQSLLPVVRKPGRPCPPPKTEDCYFWTTTGCIYGDKCFNLHRAECKGIALNSKRHFPYPK